ncbi:MAG: stage 0 sporulation family protein [Phycisphaerales bacterium JB058]
MPIVPLPQFEEDLAQYLREKEDREAYERLSAPTTMVVRFGAMLMIGEFPYDGDSKPGCGSKIVVRTHRGTELGEMLTSTCENAGCSKSVTRKEMLEYIENSGGADYPFFDSRHNKHGVKGRALRIATAEDMALQSRLSEQNAVIRKRAQELSNATGVNVKIVDAEQILGGESLTVYFLSEERVEFGPLLSALKHEYPDTRVELRQVGARDEARLTADYERCGQYCCCKNFLKVLKPVSMRSAKTQKATLDPLKISGRCGRLMCCLRYEDKTYTELKKNLPNRKTRVGTPHGDGIVIDSQILTQLVLVRLDDTRNVAVPVEELTKPGEQPKPAQKPERQARTQTKTRRDRKETTDVTKGDATETPTKPKRKRRRKKKSTTGESPASTTSGATDATQTSTDTADANKPTIGRRRRKRSGGGSKQGENQSTSGEAKRHTSESQDASGAEGAASGEKKRRRRRRRGKGGSGGGSGGGSSPSPEGGGSGGDSGSSGGGE